MTRKVNPIISGRLFPFVLNKPSKSKNIPPKSNPIRSPRQLSPETGVARQSKHTGRNIAITAALALVTLAVVKGAKDYRANHRHKRCRERRQDSKQRIRRKKRRRRQSCQRKALP